MPKTTKKTAVMSKPKASAAAEKAKQGDATASKKPVSVMAKPVSQYDEAAEYDYYDRLLREKLREKNPKMFDEYLASISANRAQQLASIRLRQARAAGAELDARGNMAMRAPLLTFQEAKNVVAPESYKDNLSEQEMIAALGPKEYARFQEIRKKQFYAEYKPDGISKRTDFSTYNPDDLVVEKALSRWEGGKKVEEGMFTPARRPITSIIMAKQ